MVDYPDALGNSVTVSSPYKIIVSGRRQEVFSPSLFHLPFFVMCSDIYRRVAEYM
jgi:hypothetical protein